MDSVVFSKYLIFLRLQGDHTPCGAFFMGYFEISASQERSESNRVLFNIMLYNSRQPLAVGPGPRYRKESMMPLRDGRNE